MNNVGRYADVCEKLRFIYACKNATVDECIDTVNQMRGEGDRLNVVKTLWKDVRGEYLPADPVCAAIFFVAVIIGCILLCYAAATGR